MQILYSILYFVYSVELSKSIRDFVKRALLHTRKTEGETEPDGAPAGIALCSHEPTTAIAASPTADQLLIYPLQLYTSHPSLLFSSSSSSLFPQQYQLYFISLLLVFFIPHFFLFYTSIA